MLSGTPRWQFIRMMVMALNSFFSWVFVVDTRTRTQKRYDEYEPLDREAKKMQEKGNLTYQEC